MKNAPDNLRIDYDSNWKRLIEDFPKEFIAFFLPTIYPLVDFSFRPRFAKQEMENLDGAKGKKGSTVADMLLEVLLKDGTKRFLFIHIEIQSSGHNNFGLKMFRPFYWILEKYGKEITALAIFVGSKIPKDPDRFVYGFGETKVLYTYPIYVVKDQDEKELKKSDNLFAIAILACKHVLKTKKKEQYEDRFNLLLELIDFIMEKFKHKNLTNEQVVSIASFTVNVLILPTELEIKFEETISKKFKKEKAMRQLSKEVLTIIETRNKEAFGVTVDELKKLVTNYQKGKEQDNKEKERLAKDNVKLAKEKEQERKEKEQMAKEKEQMEKKNEYFQMNSINNLHQEVGFDANTISKLLNLDLAFVKKVIENQS